MSEYVELYIDQGADYSTTITIQDDVTNLFTNVSGYVITSNLKRSLLSQSISGQFSCSVTDASNGEITLSMTEANTANLHIGTHMFDIKVIVGSSVSRLVEGIIIVVPAIT